MELEGLNISRKMVLLVHADHADPQGHNSFPSVERIARKSSLSERTVQYARNDLIKCGILAWEGHAPGRGQRTRKYSINVEQAENLYPPGGIEKPPKGTAIAPSRGATQDARGENDGKKGRKAPAPEPPLTVYNPGRLAAASHKLPAVARDHWDASENKVRSVFAAEGLECFMENVLPESDNGTTLVLATPTRMIRDKVERQLKAELEQALDRNIIVKIRGLFFEVKGQH